MSELTELVARLPWVTRLDQTRDCDALKWAHMPGKAVHWHGPGRSVPPEGTDKYRCRARARWQFRALRRGREPARDGVYCWQHLFSLGLLHGEDEERRYRRKIAGLRAADGWNTMLGGAAVRLAAQGTEAPPS